MPKIAYRTKRLSEDRLSLIEKANEIIADYAAQGFTLTLRQLYYQFVARDLIPNTQKSYKNLGNVINDARLCGLVDWTSIVDRTRNLQALAHWATPRDILNACADQYRTDKWEHQPYRVEVWIEKDALVGVIMDVCNEHDVPYFSCRGYTSQSEMWSAAQRLHGHVRGGQKVIVLHLGDHDPSGKDMTRDITERLHEFSGSSLKVDRLALNMDQVQQYNPPPNPAKITDTRANTYIAEFGDDSWELDALEPRVISDLIRSAVLAVRDEGSWKDALEKERQCRGQIAGVASNWDDVVDNL